jgi:opacity protein-like surface antigen
MKKFLIIAGLLTVIATPAFAQAFDPSSGTGNVLPYHWTSNGRLVRDIAPQPAPLANGDNAFAMAPGGSANVDTDSPANTGGGSEGYNWNLSHIQP